MTEPERRNVAFAPNAREAARKRRDYALLLRVARLTGQWAVEARPPKRGRRGWTINLVRRTPERGGDA